MALRHPATVLVLGLLLAPPSAAQVFETVSDSGVGGVLSPADFDVGLAREHAAAFGYDVRAVAVRDGQHQVRVSFHDPAGQLLGSQSFLGDAVALPDAASWTADAGAGGLPLAIGDPDGVTNGGEPCVRIALDAGLGYDLGTAVTALLPAYIGSPTSEFGDGLAASGRWLAVGDPGLGRVFIYRDQAPGTGDYQVVAEYPTYEPSWRTGQHGTIGMQREPDGVLLAVGSPERVFGVEGGLCDVLRLDIAQQTFDILNSHSGGIGWELGASVDVRGNRVLVGQPGNSSGFAQGGAAFLLKEEQGWILANTYSLIDAVPGMRFGEDVALGDGQLFFSVPGYDGLTANSNDTGKVIDRGAIVLADLDPSGECCDWATVTYSLASGSGGPATGYASALAITDAAPGGTPRLEAASHPVGQVLVHSFADPTVESWKIVDLGQAKPFQPGWNLPRLYAEGSFAAGDLIRLRITNAKSNANFVWMFVGLSAIHAPFQGGTLVPAPDLLLTLLPTDGAGNGGLPVAPMPPGLPPGVQLHFQAWIKNGPTSNLYSATNAMRVTTP